jgi:hypothetical protein
MKYLTKFLKILGVSLTLVLLPFSLFLVILTSFKGLKAKYANASSSFISVTGMDVHYRDEVIK